MAIKKELLEILACPKCKGDIRPMPEEDGLACDACGIVFPIKDEIPVMLLEEAVAIADWGKDND